jgi:mannose-1-phosphate guanylyltransferase/mannose-6-phosphate isomerase
MIHPVILCGGSGTRLWPLSRQSFPKQFVQLTGKESLFQASARRCQAGDFAPPLIVAGDPFRFIVLEQLAAVGIQPASVLIEPVARNTAPAVLAAALVLQARDPGALMLVLPSDHVIPDAALFRAAVARACPRAKAGDLVTFGIRPDRAETGYGYLRLAPDHAGDGPHRLEAFVEKPDADRAAAMVADGCHLWNAGIFLFTAQALVAAFAAHAPAILDLTRAAVAGAAADLGFLRLEAGAWTGLPDISIDYAIMEKAANLAVMPYGGHWSDLGGWDAVWQAGPADAAGNVLSPAATAIDCRDTLLRSEAEGLQLVGIGLEGITAVAMPDAVLIARKADAQRVKEAVAALKSRGIRQATAFQRDYRPWGWYESLAVGPRFQVKRIVVHPGAALSLQSHVHRSEHWIVVEGTAKVTIDDDVRLLAENQSVYIPLGAVHRLENPGKLPMVLIEVQTGSYLGEDDITRYRDDYGRGLGALVSPPDKSA